MKPTNTTLHTLKSTPLMFLAILCLLLSSTADSQENDKNSQDFKSKTIKEGYQLVIDRKKGNCLACHAIMGEEGPGFFGPPLMSMQARFTDRKKLYDQIWDATKRNPLTSMPPFGKHMILTDEEIDKIVTYLYTL